MNSKDGDLTPIDFSFAIAVGTVPGCQCRRILVVQ